MLGGDDTSPVIHVRLRERLPERELEELLLQDIVQLVRSPLAWPGAGRGHGAEAEPRRWVESGAGHGRGRDHDRQALKDGILLTRSKYVLREELYPPPPSIRVAISAAHSTDDIRRAANVLALAIKATVSHAAKHT